MALAGMGLKGVSGRWTSDDIFGLMVGRGGGRHRDRSDEEVENALSPWRAGWRDDAVRGAVRVRLARGGPVAERLRYERIGWLSVAISNSMMLGTMVGSMG